MKGIRTVQTWFVYVPLTKRVLEMFKTKRDAAAWLKKNAANRWAVVVRMRGTYAVPPKMHGSEK